MRRIVRTMLAGLAYDDFRFFVDGATLIFQLMSWLLIIVAVAYVAAHSKTYHLGYLTYALELALSFYVSYGVGGRIHFKISDHTGHMALHAFPRMIMFGAFASGTHYVVVYLVAALNSVPPP